MTALQNYCRMWQFIKGIVEYDNRLSVFRMWKNLNGVAEYDKHFKTTVDCDNSLSILRNVTAI